jgi:hypothetical protein
VSEPATWICKSRLRVIVWSGYHRYIEYRRCEFQTTNMEIARLHADDCCHRLEEHPDGDVNKPAMREISVLA